MTKVYFKFYKKLDHERMARSTAAGPLCISVTVAALSVLQFQKKKTDCWSHNASLYFCGCGCTQCTAIPE